MKTYTVIATFALMALAFASPAAASSSLTSSTERGYIDHGIRGYLGETMAPAADVELSIDQSREDGGSPPALNKSRGFGLGSATHVEQSREKGW